MPSNATTTSSDRAPATGRRRSDTQRPPRHPNAYR
jgi:hypothetical protein